MGMELRRVQPGRLRALPLGPPTGRARPWLSSMLTAVLLASSAGPQSVAGAQGSSSTATTAKISEPSPPRPDKSRAQNAYEAGRRAEQAGDWKAAYAAYGEATAYAPGNKEYPLRREHSRFQVIQGLVDLAERQLLAGDTAGAREYLLHVLEIDPNYAIAQERLAELPTNSPDLAPEKGPRLAGLPRLNPKPGARDFDYRGTTRSAYEELGRQFGVTMAFDGDLSDRSVRFRAPHVDFETALLVLSRQTRTFTRVVDDHTLFVTDDSAQKVRDYAPEIETTLVLPASVTTDEMNETVRMIREMTGITRTQLNTAARTLTVRSTEQNVALAAALLEQIEQPHGEMMLEIEILRVDREAAHKLGITPPTSTNVFTLSLDEIRKLQSAQNNQTLQQVLQTIFGNNTALAAALSGLGTVLPPLVAFGGGKTIFLATVPGASANFSQTLSVVRSAQRILLRAQDGKAATFFVGDRYPIDLGLLSNSLATSATGFGGTVPAGLLPRTDYPTGVAPVAVATADFNADTFQDLVVANQTDGTVWIFRGVGDGTFRTPSASDKYAVGRLPSAVAVGDFNGDGTIDIAVADAGDSTVPGDIEILLGNGDGTFQAPQRFPTGVGTHPVALLAQDINGDGILDLAIVDQANGTSAGKVLVWFGNQDRSTGKWNGTFNTGATYAVGVKPTAIRSAQFTSSGRLDLAVTNQNDNSVSVLLQNQDNTFTAKFSPATGSGPAGIAVGDFNRDGNQDIAVTNQTEPTNTVSILLGNGDGTFRAHTDFPAGSGPVGIVAGNFTGGVAPDLAVADSTGNQLSVLIDNGDGTFSAPVAIPSGNAPVAIAAADLNGDGTLDVITANQSSDSVTVTLNTLQSLIPSASSSATAGQTAYPSAEYVDLGLKVKATPRLHGDDEVTLHLEFDIKSLSGSSVNGIPILTNRTLDQTLRLRENQTSVLSGLVEASEARTISGYPWAATVPGAGYLTGNHTADTQDTETLFIVTPRALRLPPRNPHAIYAGRGEPSSPPAPVALPPGVPAPPPPPPLNQQLGPAPGTEEPGTPPPAPSGRVPAPPNARPQ
jgi:Flp pilus assembly secretin CpaC